MAEEANVEVSASETASTETSTETNTETNAEKIQKDIDDVNAKIEELKADGNDIYESAIQTLTDTRDALSEKLKLEVKETGYKVQTANEKFLEKYGMYILNGVEVLALVAIVYRLFFF